MANEIQISALLSINNGSLQYQSRPNKFSANQVAAIGPTPGYVLATTTGTLIDLSKLTTPGVGDIQNLDLLNSVEFGLYIPSINEFFPMFELLPGEIYPFRLSQFLGQEFGTSTGGTSPGGAGCQLMVRGIGGACGVKINVFNK
jgi:hypothetical protein